ncbi:MAG: Bax inhibitor-1/YccA family protein [Holosporales bacterium]|jgi:FtsH-binding integral membrane protein|nr:Bax inhibitor-1/YccA family protein [Holosporales bacterium]
MNYRFSHSSDAAVVQGEYGLRSYMAKVYNYMAAGLGITGAVAYAIYNVPSLFYAVHMFPLRYLFLIAPVALVLAFSFRINKMSLPAAQGCFWAYAALMGVSLSYIFVLYSGESIARVFFITAIMFLSMSIWGHTTKRDLTEFGSFLFMGLVGLVIASLVNIFLSSSMLHFVTSVVGVLVFTGLTAYDTQRIKSAYYYGNVGNAEVVGKQSIYGALMLYLDFINIFVSLLNIIGDRK